MCVLKEIWMMAILLIMRATCHCEMRATCLLEGGVPTMPPFLTCLFCPSKKMGGLKIIGFFETEVVFCLVGSRGE